MNGSSFHHPIYECFIITQAVQQLDWTCQPYVAYDIDPCPLLLLLLLFDLEISFKSDVEHKSKMDIRQYVGRRGRFDISRASAIERQTFPAGSTYCPAVKSDEGGQCWSEATR